MGIFEDPIIVRDWELRCDLGDPLACGYLEAMRADEHTALLVFIVFGVLVFGAGAVWYLRRRRRTAPRQE